MKEINLTRDQVALVDDEDFEYLSQWKWSAHKQGKNFYAVTNLQVGNKRTMIRMHRLIMNTPKGLETDHIDHNTLNNQKYNLRNCTHSQNQMNKVPLSKKNNKYKGVFYNKPKNIKTNNPDAAYWRAHIGINHQFIYLGNFKTEEEAALVYNKKAKELFGEFAYLNKINGEENGK